MSSLTLELLRDPELLRIAERAHADVHASAVAEGRVYTCEETRRPDRVVRRLAPSCIERRSATSRRDSTIPRQRVECLMTIDLRIQREFDARAPFPLASARLLVLSEVGSRSHGTYVPSTDPDAIDDRDYMGVIVPPASFVLGTRDWEGLNFQVEELDVVFYSFQKFARLLLKANPNVLGMLWMKEDFEVESDPIWRQFKYHRRLFAAKTVYPAFQGYAYAQLKKMTAFDADINNEWDRAVAIVRAAGWDLDAVKVKESSHPIPDRYGVRAALYEQGDLHAYSRKDKDLDEVINAAKVSVQKIHARHFQGYMGEKRKRLVQRHGYDTKNASHLIRLMRMCNEFLVSGELTVYRETDAELLRAIKTGGWSLDQVKAHAEELFAVAHDAVATSTLPDTPDRTAIDRIIVEVHASALCFSLAEDRIKG